MKAIRVVKAAYGSLRWSAVMAGDTSAFPSAVWFFRPAGVIETSNGPVSHDGGVRFFARKRDLVELANSNGFSIDIPKL